MGKKENIDLILVSVLQRRFKAICEEMGLTLLRTSRSPIFNQARDFVTGLYNSKGEMLEQAEYIPVLAFALEPACKYIAQYFGNDISPGDVIFHNDVYTGAGQYPDLGAYIPIFYEGMLVGWAATKGHMADIGGGSPGGYNPLAREVWQEALRIPPIKIYEKGKLRKDVWNLIFSNVRFKIVEEDARALIGGATVGERAIRSLIEHYGWDVYNTHVKALFDLTEERMREEISLLPEGEYIGESYMYYDGITDGSRQKIRVTVTVRQSDIWFDYTGTDPQSPTYTNAPLASSVSGLLLSFLQIIPDIPHNEGMLRPLHINIPEGTFLNPRFPAATVYGNHLAGPNSDAIFKAFFQCIPEKVCAGWARIYAAHLTGFNPYTQQPYHDAIFMGIKGGAGALHGYDGNDHISPIETSGGLTDQDYEMFELIDPHFLLRHEYSEDSAGAGCWRGGLGVVTEFVIEGENVTGEVHGDGLEEPPFGLAAGKPPQTLNKIELRFPDGSKFVPKGKSFLPPMPKGTVFHEEITGGGGYGDPYLRPAEKVAEEVRNELLSVEKASELYGVVVDPFTFKIDWQKTQEIREKKDNSKL